MAAEIRTVGVVGLGAMGAGIAQLCVEAGVETVGREVTDELGAKARERIAHFLTRKVEKGQLEQGERDAAVERLTLTTDLEDVRGLRPRDRGDRRGAAREARAVRGARPHLPTRRGARDEHERALRHRDRGRDLAPERVVGMHFFNPAPLMPLVEIVRAELSGDDAVETAFAFGERLGKYAIRCHDTPGFVVNRVLIPLLNDCIRVLDEARLSPEDLDAGLKHGAGWPMGPCTLVDLVGIDVHVHASEALYEKLREPRMAPPPRLVAMRNAGLLGRKSGRGFYSYD